jgi:Leucine-rich repeat (LRR) protein
MRHLTSLRVLDLGSNALPAVPSSVTALCALTKLSLRDNYIQNVPATLARLVDLKVCLPLIGLTNQSQKRPLFMQNLPIKPGHSYFNNAWQVGALTGMVNECTTGLSCCIHH